MEQRINNEANSSKKDINRYINIVPIENDSFEILNFNDKDEGKKLKSVEQEIEVNYLNDHTKDENVKEENDKKKWEINEEIDKVKAYNYLEEKKINKNGFQILREHKYNEPFEKRLNDITERQMKKIQEAKSFKEISGFPIHKLLFKKIYPQIVEKAILIDNGKLKASIEIGNFELLLNYKTEV